MKSKTGSNKKPVNHLGSKFPGPGTEEKIQLLIKRVEARQPLFPETDPVPSPRDDAPVDPSLIKRENEKVKICLHCKRPADYIPARGLCRRCFYSPIRNQYPPLRGGRLKGHHKSKTHRTKPID